MAGQNTDDGEVHLSNRIEKPVLDYSTGFTQEAPAAKRFWQHAPTVMYIVGWFVMLNGHNIGEILKISRSSNPAVLAILEFFPLVVWFPGVVVSIGYIIHRPQKIWSIVMLLFNLVTAAGLAFLIYSIGE